MPNSIPGPWHYEGHYILTDSEPQVVIAERVSEANRGLIASAPQLFAALADVLDDAEHFNPAGDYTGYRELLKAAGRIP